jgi:pullulanase/glycogen debranching enzyme
MDLRVEGIEVILDVVYNHTAAVSVSTKPIRCLLDAAVLL